MTEQSPARDADSGTPGDVHIGARWVRASLQVNPFDYVGVNAPSTTFTDQGTYNTALLDECEALGIEIIGITDHWRVDSAQSLIEAAAARGIVALPGFEASSTEGYHLLILFAAGTDVGVINGAIGACGAQPGCDNGTMGDSYADILAKMSDQGALVIPAHVNVPNSGMLTGRGGAPLQNAIKNPALHALGITPGEADAKDQEAIIKGLKPFDRPHPLAVLHADDICHPDKLANVGSSTWFKMSHPGLEGLKHAVRTPETRVSLVDPESVARVLFRSLTWTGGFLNGVTVAFADDLTAFIGGRGTGKSTVIESIRYALDIKPIGDSAARDHQSIVRDVIENGTIVELELDAITPTAGRFTIQRTVPHPPIVLDQAGVRTELTPFDVIGDIEIFGQHELAEVAQQPTSVATMIQRFSGEIETTHVRELQAKLAENRAQVEAAEKEQARLEEKLSDIPRLEDAVKHFKQSEWSKKLDEQQRLSQDEAILKDGNERIETAADEVRLLVEEDLGAALRQSFEALDTSEEKGTLSKVAEATKALADALDAGVASMLKALEEAGAKVEAAHAEWKAKTDPQRAKHAEVIRELKAQGHDPDKFIATTNALDDLRAKATQREVLKKRRDGLLKMRSTLLGDLWAAEAADRKRLSAAITRANDATNGAVIVKPIPSPDRGEFSRLVDAHLSNAKKQLLEVVDATDFSPRDFVAAARAGNTELESKYGIRGAQALAIESAGEGFLRAIEERVVGHAVEVSLDVSSGEGARQYRKLDSLSKGQRATALLLLLLGAAESPLVIDQPEDDLDNRFVYSGVVHKLRSLKGRRQIIVSTHNANVPVLGDAELIVALEGDGQHGWPMKERTGSLDDKKVREIAEDILEGGHTAFDTRKHLYGF